MQHFLTKPLKEYGILSLDEAKIRLNNLSLKLVAELAKRKEQEEIKEINMLGLGNSISAGWSAINNDVKPLVNKLEDFIMPYSIKYDVPINIRSYILAANNSNQNIYELLKENPDLKRIHALFLETFLEWKRDFKDTPFENYVDKEIALAFYPENNVKLKDNFGEDKVTFSFFNGSTGLFCNEYVAISKNPSWQEAKKILTKEGRKKILLEEQKYLIYIRDFLLKQSKSSYVTIGNFPYCSTPLGAFINPIFKEFNNHIKSTTNLERTSFYNGITIAFIEQYEGKLKLDNHPTIEEQYTSLVGYVNHLLKNIANTKRLLKK